MQRGYWLVRDLGYLQDRSSPTEECANVWGRICMATDTGVFLPDDAAPDFSQIVMKNTEKLLVDNLVLLHARLNCLSSGTSDLAPRILPPRAT